MFCHIKEYLLQEDYGDQQDCTLTSITTVIHNLNGENRKPQEIYNIVEDNAYKYFYNGKIGTFPLFIKAIFDKSLKKLGYTNYKTKVKCIKGLGFNFNTIINLLLDNKKIILSMFNGKYLNHTVTIIGFTENRKLIISDNWTAGPVIIDYDEIGIISQINYIF